MKSPKRDYLLRGAVAAAVVGYFHLFSSIFPLHLADILDLLQSYGLWFVLGLIPIAVVVERWRILLKGQGLIFSRFYLARIWLSGYFLGFWAPRGLGRDVVRWYATANASGDGVRTGTVLVLERALSWVSLAACVALFAPGAFWALGVYPAKLRFGGLVLALIVVSFLFLSVLLQPRILQVAVSIVPVPLRFKNGINRIVDALLAYRETPSTLFMAVLLGIVEKVLLGCGVLLWCFDSKITMLKAILLTPVWSIRHILDFALINTTFDKVWWTMCYGSPVPDFSHAPTTATTNVTVIDVMIPGCAIVFLLWGLKVSWLQQILRPVHDYHLSREETSLYRWRILDAVLAGLGGGLLGGALCGLGESSWAYWWFMSGAEELHAFWWGSLMYGVICMPVGAVVALFFVYVYLVVGRFRHPGGTFAACLAGVVAMLFLVVGRFRFARDVLDDHPLSLVQIFVLLCLTVVLFLVIERAGSFFFTRLHFGRIKAVLVMLLVFVMVMGVGAGLNQALRVPVTAEPFAPSRTAQGPNVFLIVIDTLRADYLPLYGATGKASTPNLDAFAKDAVVFRNSFSQAPWTKPSFGTIFTGQYPGVHGAEGKASVLPEQAVTLAETLRDSGYYTQAFPNNRNLLPYYGLDQGFTGYDYLMPHLYFGASFSSERLAIYEVLRRVWIRSKLPHIDVEHFYRPAPEENAAALNWLDHNEVPRDMPFLLFTHYMDPHDPYMTQDPGGTGYASIVLGTNPDPDMYLEPMRAAYIDEVERVDKAIGEFMEGLRKRGLYDDAMIVFTADHGEEFYEHKGWSHGPTLYEEVTHIPLLIKFPGNRHGGEVNTGIARHVDIMPTILKAVGIPLPQTMDGIPLIDDSGAFNNQQTAYSIAETDFTGSVARSVRNLDAKLIRANKNNPRGLAPVEYYDLNKDPGELSNATGKGDPREEALSQELSTMMDYIRKHALK